MYRILVVLLMSFVCFNSHAQFTFADSTQAQKFRTEEEFYQVLTEAEELFLEKLNAYRKSKNAKKLKNVRVLDFMALNHSLWMRHHTKLTHNQKKGSAYFSGISLRSRLEFVNPKSDVGELGENVAYINVPSKMWQSSPDELAEFIAQDFFDTWKNSPGHRQNMLSKTYQFSGVSFLKIGNTIYGTQVFGGQ
jgi:uncharacterized protein YkwD